MYRAETGVPDLDLMYIAMKPSCNRCYDRRAPFPTAELAYGDSKRSELITPGAVLIFELDLIEVQGPSAPMTAEL